MRRRRKARTPAIDLRHLALAGRWEEVRALLAERIARDPHDAEAHGELERLRQGLPLRATEGTLARKRREEKEMLEELQAELELRRNTPGLLEQWAPPLLARRRKRIAYIRAALGNRLPDELEQESSSYLRELTAKWSSYRNKRRLRLGLALGLPLVVAATGATFMVLRHRAEQAEHSLNQALQSGEILRVEHALGLADSGANKLVNPNLPERILQVKTWLTRTRRQQAELHQQLTKLETGQGHISSLPLTRRADLEATLQSLPPSMNELRERWKRLCNKEARALARQRSEVMQRFNTTLPPLPELNATPEEDDARLRQQQEALQENYEEWQAARSLFSLSGNYGELLRARLTDIQLLREDIAALRRTLALLPTARSYARYRSLMEACSPKRYAPALRAMDIRDHLPDEHKLRDQMQNHGRQLPPGMLAAARHALLDGGASFPAAFPANAQQVQYMEDVFTATVLQKVLYEMSAPTLPSFIVEERPVPDETSVTFSPSPLTPGYTLDTPRRITWHNPQAVYIRRIDATPLLRETGITREQFFSRGNVPTLLDALLRFDHEGCPTLARAYVFKRLLEVMAAHEWPTMLGIAYAPTLRADARSFANLDRELDFSLEAGCWLLSTPEATRAEEAWTRWFHERRHRHYAQEIARNFGALVQVHPRYVGFIGEDGHPQLHRDLPEGTLLWYIGAEGLTTTPMGESLESPALYSPVFIVAKD